MFKKTPVVAAAIVAFGLYVFTLLSAAGYFSGVSPKGYGYCERIPNLIGPEDMAFLPDHSRIVISVNPRHDYSKNTFGNLYLYEPSTFKISAGLASINFPFFPNGIDLFENGNEVLLYAVNQRDPSTTTVEVFRFNGKLFVHQRTFESPLFQSGEDILVTEKDQFFITSRFGSSSSFMKKLSFLFRNATGYVSFFDGTSARKVAEDIFFANGLARYGKNLFVSATMEERIRIFEITPEGLIPSKDIDVEGGPDNIYYEDGSLYIALHPKIHALNDVMSDRKAKSPSRLMQISNWDEGPLEKNILFESAGGDLSNASSVLPLANDRILMGSIFDNHLLDCSLR
jgi:hypothetical protein